MGWKSTQPRILDAPVPRRVLRDLFLRQGIALRAHVLDAGCGQGDFVRYLTSLGLHAAGLDESDANIDDAQRLSPDLDFFVGTSPREQFGPRPADYDVIFARALSGWSNSLLSRDALFATAGLLTCLRPGGVLIFGCGNGDSEKRHRTPCFVRHLSFFPGHCRVDRFSSGSPVGSAADELVTVSLRVDRIHQHCVDRLLEHAHSRFEHSCCESAIRRAEAA